MRKLAILSTLVLGLFPIVGTTAPTLGDKPPRWEYAELTFERVITRPGAVGQPGAAPVPPRVVIRWSTAEEEFEEKGWEEMADKLKAPPPKKEGSPATVHKLRVLNRLGAGGWEVIEHNGTDGTDGRAGRAGTATWLLKRRVP
jgi:hypothetical protein